MFYNTTSEQGQQLDIFIVTAKTQEEAIHNIFKVNTILSPSQALTKYISSTSKNVPLTSIRRCISNLTSKGILVKLDEKIEGSYGRNEFKWKLA